MDTLSTCRVLLQYGADPFDDVFSRRPDNYKRWESADAESEYPPCPLLYSLRELSQCARSTSRFKIGTSMRQEFELSKENKIDRLFEILDELIPHTYLVPEDSQAATDAFIEKVRNQEYSFDGEHDELVKTISTFSLEQVKQMITAEIQRRIS